MRVVQPGQTDGGALHAVSQRKHLYNSAISCFPMKTTNTLRLITTNHKMVNGSVPTVSQAVIFEVSITLLLTIQVFWEAKLCCWESVSQHSK
jgi:hypothetical protein